MTRAEPGVSEIEQILIDEALALRQARLGDLSRIADAKEHMVTRLRIQPLGADTAQRLRDMAMRNAAMLEAAMGGMRAAMTVLDQARAGGEKLQTYDMRGSRTIIASGAERILRRA